MRALNRLAMLAVILTLCSCGSKTGPLIELDTNVRSLCGFAVTMERDDRCKQHDHCAADQFCWESGEDYHWKGFCRQCDAQTPCDTGLECDHNWCHTPCTQASDCADGTFCTSGFCRKPEASKMSFAFCNGGDEDLKVRVNETKLYGAAGACAFARWQWEPAGEEVVTLPPGDCSLYLNVLYTPPDTGEFRGFLQVHSNSAENGKLPLLLCGQAMEATCQASVDGECPACASCVYEDFADMVQNPQEASCPDFP